MTVFTGDVKAQVQALVDAVSAVPDFDLATLGDLAALRTIARRSVDLVDAAVLELDPQLAGDGATVAGIASGRDPHASIAAFRQLQADMSQLSQLIDLGSYTGRVEINLRQVTG